MSEKQYAERDYMDLDDAGCYFIRHMDAMTCEKLHGKAEIAGELGYRDMIIDQQKAINAELLEALKKFVDAMRAGVTKQEIMASIDAADKNARSVIAKATGEQQ